MLKVHNYMTSYSAQYVIYRLDESMRVFYPMYRFLASDISYWLAVYKCQVHIASYWVFVILAAWGPSQ